MENLENNGQLETENLEQLVETGVEKKEESKNEFNKQKRKKSRKDRFKKFIETGDVDFLKAKLKEFENRNSKVGHKMTVYLKSVLQKTLSNEKKGDKKMGTQTDLDGKKVPENKKHRESANGQSETQNKNETAESRKQKQKKYVLFIGNLPYNTSKEKIVEHFSSIEGFVDIRMPKTDGKQQKGFAFLEVADSETYEYVFTQMQGTFLEGRKIKVEYTIAGSNNKKRENKIKSKNLKLNSLQRQGIIGKEGASLKRRLRRQKQLSAIRNHNETYTTG